MTAPVPPAPGARPAGIDDPDAAAASIRQMFDAIAPTYDRANHLLSVGIDRLWWRRAARTLRPILRRPEARVLDLCCGTGDMTLALERWRPAAGEPIQAADFSAKMLALAAPKFAGRNIVALEADALRLPFPACSLDLVTFAFGFRNLSSYVEGLAEVHRVLRPGGEIAILECNQPSGMVGALYSFYFHHMLPTLGGIISGAPRAYAYLPDSVVRFPRPPQMKALLAEAGFADPTWDSYTFGTAGLYRARRR